ncbi:hypothetical protein BDD14_5401 [Edaphobacter modestus]|uniref:Uncharacterized protein n=1 Tax=Edaphobacter modestus TaxID=388466 RepID=A0A4Q7Z2B1_9BACT|nr:hypothetical protein BDD14_5401 [Edaphobacter modestus]
MPALAAKTNEPCPGAATRYTTVARDEPASSDQVVRCAGRNSQHTHAATNNSVESPKQAGSIKLRGSPAAPSNAPSTGQQSGQPIFGIRANKSGQLLTVRKDHHLGRLSGSWLWHINVSLPERRCHLKPVCREELLQGLACEPRKALCSSAARVSSVRGGSVRS